MRVNSYVFTMLVIFLLATPFVAGCDKSLDFNNKAPEISSISKSACYVSTHGDVGLTCNVQDPDDDPISTQWSAAYGNFVPESGEGESIFWAPPQQPGTYTVTATVSDKIDESSKSIEIEVGEELTVGVGNTVVSGDGSFYVISAPQAIQVDVGANLTINSGVTIVVNVADGGLDVRGYMEINGTEDAPVYFKPNICPGETGVWEGIAFTGQYAVGSMTHTNITMAIEGVGVADGAEVTIDSCFIHDGVGIGINVENSKAHIHESRISDNGSGIHVLDSGAEVTDCEIRDNSQYGIWLEENQSGFGESFDVTIEGCAIAANDGDGVIISWRGLPTINYNSIQFNGVASGGYDLKLFQYFDSSGVNAKHNYWGVTEEDDIREVIFDGADYLPPAPNIYVDFSDWLRSQP